MAKVLRHAGVAVEILGLGLGRISASLCGQLCPRGGSYGPAGGKKGAAARCAAAPFLRALLGEQGAYSCPSGSEGGASSRPDIVKVKDTWPAQSSLACSDGWSEEMAPKSPHQPHSHRLPRTITGLPQCGQRILVIAQPPFLLIGYHGSSRQTSLSCRLADGMRSSTAIHPHSPPGDGSGSGRAVCSGAGLGRMLRVEALHAAVVDPEGACKGPRLI